MPSPNPPSLRPSVPPSSAICPPPRFDEIPHELKLVERWAVWRIECNRTGAWRKMCFQPSGRRATRKDPKTWASFAAVRSAFDQSLRSAAPYDGIAFALGDGFAAIQLAGVLAPCATGGARAPSIEEQEQAALNASGHTETPNTKHQTLPAWASQLVADFATYTEFNVDGQSLTLFLHGPIRRKPADNVLGPLPHPEGGLIEATDEPRFVGVTGRRWPANSPYQIEPRKTQFQTLTRHLHSGSWPFPIPDSSLPTQAAPAVPSGVPCATGSARALPTGEQEHEPHKPSGHVECGHPVLPPFIPSSLNPFIASQEAILPSATTAAAAAPEAARIADQIVELALTEFRLGRTPADETFAVALHGPNIAHMLRGGTAPLRKTLARDFRRRHARTLNSSALTDALTVIDAEAGELEPEQVALRVAHLPLAPPASDSLHSTTACTLEPSSPSTLNPEPRTLNADGIVIDLGRPDGKAVVITPTGWRIVDRSPVLFRRTSLTAQLPLPVPGGSLDQLRSLVNVSDDGYQMLRGWLVAALFPSIAHPILVLRGEQGTGKSTALRMLVGLVDPSAALALSEPNDSEHWVMMAHGGWCLALDNVAGISAWFSEALCRAVTGEGVIRRRAYTDGDFSVIAFRRVLALTCINLGPVADDLAARLLPVGLELIDEPARLSETKLLARFEALKPQLFGALLDEVAATLRNLPNVHLEKLPRMADFANVLAALPLAPGTPPDSTPLAIYLRLIERLTLEVVEGDPVTMALAELMKTRQTWQGTATELLSAIAKTESNRGLPKSPHAMTMRLNRLAPALKSVGIAVGYNRGNDYMRTRQVILTSIPFEPPVDSSSSAR